jgi:uncharacterized protein (TIGR00255 family)
MVRSMTGYGQAMMNANGYQITVEIRSVNHRFCEMAIRTGREFIFIEEVVKRKVSEQVKRGKVDLFITIERSIDKSNQKLAVDWQVVSEYVGAHDAIAERYRLDPSVLRPFDLLTLPDAVRLDQPSYDAAEITESVLETVTNACHQLIHMRESEGKVLKEEISSRIRQISLFVEEIRNRAPIVTVNYREKLAQRMKDFLTGNWAVDEARLMNEVALFSERANIDEELTRLGSHCQQFQMTLDMAEPVGRKLDFLVQEMNREVNTIGAKANDIEISKNVVDLKAELEKIKEQVQNIE